MEATARTAAASRSVSRPYLSTMSTTKKRMLLMLMIMMIMHYSCVSVSSVSAFSMISSMYMDGGNSPTIVTAMQPAILVPAITKPEPLLTRMRMNSNTPTATSTTNDPKGADSRSSNDDDASRRMGTNKQQFYDSLETVVTLNTATKHRTALLSKMVNEKLVIPVQATTTQNDNTNKNKNKNNAVDSSSIIPTISYAQPGNVETFLAPQPASAFASSSFASSSIERTTEQADTEPTTTTTTATANSIPQLAVGTWKVIYAPHMTTLVQVFSGGGGGNHGSTLDVQYQLDADQTIVSHAYYHNFPFGIGSGYLSVSGTYGSIVHNTNPNNNHNNENKDTATSTPTYYSKVNFDKAWIKRLPATAAGDAARGEPEPPYASLEDVPASFVKTLINGIGQRAFIDDVAIFPVSFLDTDTVVFDFEAFGTKICARKVS